MKYRFASLVYDAEAGTLHGDGGEIRLRPQVFQVLGVLLREAPRVVDAQTLIDEVWQVPHVSQSSIQRSISELRRVLGDDAREARFIDTVYRRGYRFVARVECVASAGGEAASEEPREPDPPVLPPAAVAGDVPLAPRRRVGPWLAAVAVLGAFAWASTRPWHPAPTPVAPSEGGGVPAGTRAAPPPQLRAEGPVLAVMDLQGSSPPGDDSWLAAALAELIRLHLLQQGEVVVVPRSSVHRAVATTGVAADADPWALRALARALPAEYVVGGRYHLAEGPPPRRVDLTLELVDAAAASRVEIAVEGDEAALSHLAARAAEELRRQVVGPTLSDARRETGRGLGAVLPERLAETAALFRGLEAMSGDDPVAARETLEEVARKAPDSPLARWALARVLAELGWHERARREVAEALRAVDDMPREIALVARALAQELDGETAAALETYRALAAFYPGDFEHGLAAVRLEIRTGESERAATRLADLRGLAVGPGDHLRLDLAAARLAHHDDDLEQMVEVARLAATAARDLEHDYRLAEALLLGGQAYRHRGARSEALELLSEATRVFDRLDASRGATEARLALASLNYEKEDFAEARSYALQALDSSRRLGDFPGQAGAWLQLGRADFGLGDFELAMSEIEQAERAYREAGRENGEAAARTSRALILYELGRLDEAAALIERSVEIYRRLGRRGNVVSSASNLGLIRNEIGDYRGAKESLTEALEAVGHDEAYRAAYAHFSLGRQAHEAMELDDADHHLQVALDGFQAAEQRSPTFSAHLERAGVALARGRLDQARRELTAAADVTAPGNPSFALEAARARVLLRTGPLDAAESHLRIAASALEDGENPKDHAVHATWTGELHELRGDREQARESYEAARRLYADSGRRARADRLTLQWVRLALDAPLVDAETVAAARREAERCREHSKKRGHGAGEAEALVMEAAASLAAGDAEAALFELRASEQAGPLPAPERYGRNLLGARALATSGKPEAGLAAADAVAREAAEAGEERWRLEAEVVRCELGRRHGFEDSARCREAVRDARILGFEALASRGEGVLDGHGPRPVVTVGPAGAFQPTL